MPLNLTIINQNCIHYKANNNMICLEPFLTYAKENIADVEFSPFFLAFEMLSC